MSPLNELRSGSTATNENWWPAALPEIVEPFEVIVRVGQFGYEPWDWIKENMREPRSWAYDHEFSLQQNPSVSLRFLFRYAEDATLFKMFFGLDA